MLADFAEFLQTKYAMPANTSMPSTHPIDQGAGILSHIDIVAASMHEIENKPVLTDVFNLQRIAEDLRTSTCSFFSRANQHKSDDRNAMLYW